MNQIAKKSSSKIQEIVKNTGKRVGYEAGEISQHIQKQVLGGPGEIHPQSEPKSDTTSPITEVLGNLSQPELSEEEKNKLQIQFMQRTKNLEEEVEKYRKLRREKEKLTGQGGTTDSNLVKPGEPMFKPLEIPKSKPSRGRMPGVPGTAKGETGPEVRKSKQ